MRCHSVGCATPGRMRFANAIGDAEHRSRSHDAPDSRLRWDGQRDRDARARGRVQRPLDLTGLTFSLSFPISRPQVIPRYGILMTGPPAASNGYHGSINGPEGFGSSIFTRASFGSGDRVGIIRTLDVVVPSGYVSGTAHRPP